MDPGGSVVPAAGPWVREQGEAGQALLLADRVVRSLDGEPDSAAAAAMFRLRRGAALFGACTPQMHNWLWGAECPPLRVQLRQPPFAEQ